MQYQSCRRIGRQPFEEDEFHSEFHMELSPILCRLRAQGQTKEHALCSHTKAIGGKIYEPDRMER
jgi:hypothetical protein